MTVLNKIVLRINRGSDVDEFLKRIVLFVSVCFSWACDFQYALSTNAIFFSKKKQTKQIKTISVFSTMLSCKRSHLLLSSAHSKFPGVKLTLLSIHMGTTSRV